MTSLKQYLASGAKFIYGEERTLCWTRIGNEIYIEVDSEDIASNGGYWEGRISGYSEACGVWN